MKNSGIEWIGEIPGDWEVVYLSSIFNEHKRKNIGLICKNLLSLSYGKIKRKDINTTDGLLPESFEGYNIIEKGDIVLRLTDLQNDQKSLRTGITHETGLITSAYITIRCLPKIALPDYMHYYLHSFDTSKGFYGMGDGVRQGLNYDGIKKILMLLPPINEQQKIADYLDKKCAAVDRLIENQRAQIEKLKEYKQSVITEAVTRGLDPSAPLKDSGVEWLGKIPEKWVTKKANIIFSVIGSGTTPNSSNSSYYDGDIPWIQSGDLNCDVITKTQKTLTREALRTFSALKLYEDPFLVIAMYGASIGNIAYSRLTATTNQACCVLAKCYENLRYFYYAFIASKSILIDKAKGGTQPNISQDIIKRHRLPVPPLEEQRQIADYLDKKCAEIDKLIAIKQQKIETLTEYKNLSYTNTLPAKNRWDKYVTNARV